MSRLTLVCVLFFLAGIHCASWSRTSVRGLSPAQDLNAAAQARGVNAGPCVYKQLACVNPGQACTNFPDNQQPICLEGTCNSTGTCPDAPGTIGDPCTEECSNGLECHPVSFECVNPQLIHYGGDSCSTNLECLFLNTSYDFVSVCQSGKCLGAASGSLCVDTLGCDFNMCCNTGVCGSCSNAGGACDPDDSNCTGSYECAQGTCVRLGSVGVGGKCSTSYACADGLFCGDTSLTCQSPVAAGQLCTSSSDCPTDSYCSCDGTSSNTTCVSPDPRPQGSASILTAVNDCLDAQNCGGISCAISKCPTQYCSYRSFALKYRAGPTCLDSYTVKSFENTYPDTCHSSLGNKIEGSFLCLIMAVASLSLSSLL